MSTPLVWSKGVSAGRYLADTDEAGGTRYLILKEGRVWMLRAFRTEQIAGVTLIVNPLSPEFAYPCESLREAKTMAGHYADLEGVKFNRRGRAARRTYGLEDRGTVA